MHFAFCLSAIKRDGFKKLTDLKDRVIYYPRWSHLGLIIFIFCTSVSRYVFNSSLKHVYKRGKLESAGCLGFMRVETLETVSNL